MPVTHSVTAPIPDLNSNSFNPLWHTPIQQSAIQPVVAKQFETDVFSGFWTSMDTFVQSGQAWALLIGLIIGYVIKSLTSYG